MAFSSAKGAEGFDGLSGEFSQASPVVKFILKNSPAAMLILNLLAIVSTVVRLFHRVRRRQLWWDDFWAFSALLMTIWGTVAGLVIALVPLGACLHTRFVAESYFSKSVPDHMAPMAQSFLTWSFFFINPSQLWSVLPSTL